MNQSVITHFNAYKNLEKKIKIKKIEKNDLGKANSKMLMLKCKAKIFKARLTMCHNAFFSY